MKVLWCALPLLTAFPAALSAQSGLSGLLGRPAVRLSIGPLSLRATFDERRVLIHAAPRAARRAPERMPWSGTKSTASAARVLATGDLCVGTRYTYGGETPSGGFDCSGFVQYVFGRHGVELPRTSREQATAGTPLTGPVTSLRPGDLMLFSSRGAGVDHVAIYAGNGRILHSSAGLTKVGYDDLSSARGEWYLARHVASRRVLN